MNASVRPASQELITALEHFGVTGDELREMLGIDPGVRITAAHVALFATSNALNLDERVDALESRRTVSAFAVLFAGFAGIVGGYGFQAWFSQSWLSFCGGFAIALLSLVLIEALTPRVKNTTTHTSKHLGAWNNDRKVKRELNKSNREKVRKFKHELRTSTTTTP
jgi:hypothetical protein